MNPKELIGNRRREGLVMLAELLLQREEIERRIVALRGDLDALAKVSTLFPQIIEPPTAAPESATAREE